MSDYILKSQVLEIGLDRLQRKNSRMLFSAVKNNDADKIKELTDIHDGFVAVYKDLWFEALRINNAHYHRCNRLQKRIYAMLLTGPCIFLTFTFTDKTLNITDYEYRRRLVREFCKEHSDYYIANIDYGEDNEREHYHAIIQCQNVDYSLWHRYGAIKGLRIHADLEDAKRLSKYVSKLTNHAIKQTTRGQRIIYGKSVKNLLDMIEK